MKALVDADSIVYACGFAVEHNRYYVYLYGEEENGAAYIAENKQGMIIWLESQGLSIGNCFYDIHKEIEPIENCLHLVKITLESILYETQSESFRVFITGHDNYRKDIAVTKVYKGNRDPSHRPVYYKEIRDYLVKKWKAEVIDEVEADDAVAINQKEDTIICTIDKDLNQVPGWHYNWRKTEKFWVDELEGHRSFWTQMLTGDTSDNVQGVPGIGPKRAEKLLKECSSYEQMKCAVGFQYAVAYDDPEAALLEHGKLLWMRRSQEDIWSI